VLGAVENVIAARSSPSVRRLLVGNVPLAAVAVVGWDQLRAGVLAFRSPDFDPGCRASPSYYRSTTARVRASVVA